MKKTRVSGFENSPKNPGFRVRVKPGQQPYKLPTDFLQLFPVSLWSKLIENILIALLVTLRVKIRPFFLWPPLVSYRTDSHILRAIKVRSE